MLADACFDFIVEVQIAAKVLVRQIELYGAPENSIQYGGEVDTLRRARVQATVQPIDTAAMGRLIALASPRCDDEIPEHELEAAIAEIPPRESAH
jgi:hypothetical protein